MKCERKCRNCQISSLDGWKVGDKYFYSKFGKIIETTVCYNDNKDGICDFDMFMIEHGYAKRTAEEVHDMTNREWMLLIAKEFNVSNTVAKRMLSAMYQVRKISSVTRDIRQAEQIKQEKEEKQFKVWEEQDQEDYKFLY